jgi:hypothetical protein
VKEHQTVVLIQKRVSPPSFDNIWRYYSGYGVPLPTGLNIRSNSHYAKGLRASWHIYVVYVVITVAMIMLVKDFGLMGYLWCAFSHNCCRGNDVNGFGALWGNTYGMRDTTTFAMVMLLRNLRPCGSHLCLHVFTKLDVIVILDG